ncbi:hypothetical protein [Streptococcus pneumoniae]|uniref:hypothetical protein n=1 Tax=Streptococcus pneumoniae TaxID=1313 RepID=UPI0006DC6920|nr:hypothetical protein [Streptococcus pneumoniae]
MTSSAGKKLARLNVLFLIPGNIIAYPLKLTYNQNPAKEKDKSIEDRAKTVLTFILSNSNMRSKDKKPSEINLRT